jgi:large subunit ribosomal protein L15
MQANNLTRQTARKFSRQFGRGGKRGKTAGRGTKGQNARAGRKFRPVMRDTIKKLPKLRGYRFNSPNTKMVAINLADLKVFSKGETVNPKTLVEKNVLNLVLGKAPKAKILGNGEISNALTFENVFVSKEAKAKIEKAGGNIIEMAKPEVKAKKTK